MHLIFLRRDFLRLFAAALAAPTTPTPDTAPPTRTPAPRATPTPVPSPTLTPRAQPWLQSLRPLTLWSGPDEAAEALGTAARWDYFLITRPQVGGRLYVLVARSRNYAWLDANAVGPSGPPPAGHRPAGRRPTSPHRPKT